MNRLLLQISSKKHTDFVEITREVSEAIQDQGWSDGLLHLFVAHTTCGLTINENADPDVLHDLEIRLNDLAPWQHKQDLHGEGNSAAHLKSSMMGVSLSIPVADGQMTLGTWQGIYLCEFDGPRTRKIHLTFLK
ncbi:MAG: secondary thiamine-phosphate synthase enzyme YjbQ [SAR324 cluster bacterium]|nr:secondary thiamine-phosphate synthase enzyme YjbQ [SAR324 cluster bacterium]